MLSGFFDGGRIARSMKQIKRVEKKLFQQFNLWLPKLYSRLIKPASVLGRRVFEFKHIHRFLGGLVAFSFFALAILPNSIWGLQTVIETRYSTIPNEPIETKTEHSIRLPVESFVITQGYHLFHPGIDLAAAKGTPVYPIMDGVVIKVAHDRFAFGNHVIVQHGGGRQSLYAHLSKIEVQVEEQVSKDSILGLVGSTGWSTGPHLHLQIWQDNGWTNPRAFFEGYFGQRLASTK